MNVTQAIERILDAISDGIGTTLWLVAAEAEDPQVPGCRGIEPAALARSKSVLTCRCGRSVLVVPVAGDGVGTFYVRSAHLPASFAWTREDSDLTLENTAEPAYSATCSPLPILRALLQQVVLVCRNVASRNPSDLAIVADDVGSENVCRLSRSLALHILPQPPCRRQVYSLARVPSLGVLIRSVVGPDPSAWGTRFMEALQSATQDVPATYNIMSLSGCFLVRPFRQCTLCTDVFHELLPEDCVRSDLTHFWEAVMTQRIRGDASYTPPYTCTNGGCIEIISPIFADDLCVGALFAGQMLQSPKHLEATIAKARLTVQRAKDEIMQGSSETSADQIVNAEQAIELAAQGLWWDTDDSPKMRPQKGEFTSKKDRNRVLALCQALAELTGLLYTQWCDARANVGLRRTLIQGASGTGIRELAQHVCSALPEHVDITDCSVWLDEGANLLALVAATAERMYVRPEPGATIVAHPAQELIGVASYQYGEGLTGGAAAARQARYVADATRESGWRGKYNEAVAECQLLLVPFGRGTTVRGVIRAVKPCTMSRIPPRDIERLVDFADEFAIAVEEKRLRLAEAASAASAQEHAEHARCEAARFRDIALELAHEFRSPLHNILSQISRLRGMLPSGEEIRVVGKAIEEEALRAKRQMEATLSLQTEQEYRFRESWLGPILHTCAREYEARAAKRNCCIIVWDSAKKLRKVTMDPDRIRQVVSNLIDNAVKWSFNGERIEIKGKDSPSTVTFHVIDRGTGIPPDKTELIFEAFERKILEDRRRFVPGTGIGLRIVREIVRAHNGRVTVKSVPFLADRRRQGPQEGHEVTFTVTLPKRRDAGSGNQQ